MWKKIKVFNEFLDIQIDSAVRSVYRLLFCRPKKQPNRIPTTSEHGLYVNGGDSTSLSRASGTSALSNSNIYDESPLVGIGSGVTGSTGIQMSGSTGIQGTGIQMSGFTGIQGITGSTGSL